MNKPIIGVLCCARMIDEDSDLHHVVFRSYIEFIKDTLGAVPILIPALSPGFMEGDIDQLVDIVDGFFLPGSPSNISLRRAKGKPDVFYITDTPGTHDLLRDYTAMNILHYSLTADKLLLAVCRGFQEMNVFFGGDLHKDLHLIPGKRDHRAGQFDTLQDKYAPAHEVSVTSDAFLNKIFAEQDNSTTGLMVNSLHTQGISVVGEDLVVECLAPDGTVEAIRHKNSSFIYGVQWHLEWMRSPLDSYIARAFLSQCSRRIHKGD
ncbi:TPA: gamma-glutamyl-gamma-aminobutyrate hydrolase family protein [Klebsiella pneumoniae]|nr:gamma-glutamyl-gamma-aminobutyrate hydrolase family protein [Klebsiella pneumoniae]